MTNANGFCERLAVGGFQQFILASPVRPSYYRYYTEEVPNGLFLLDVNLEQNGNTFSGTIEKRIVSGTIEKRIGGAFALTKIQGRIDGKAIRFVETEFDTSKSNKGTGWVLIQAEVTASTQGNATYLKGTWRSKANADSSGEIHLEKVRAATKEKE